MNVDEIPSTTLTASVMNELDRGGEHPPRDEYATAQDLPPVYGTFENAYSQWRAADNAKQAITALDNDPALAVAETKLKEGEKILKEMKEKSEEAFKALHIKRTSLASFFNFKRSKRKSSKDIRKTTGSNLAPKSLPDQVHDDLSDNDCGTSQRSIGSTSASSNTTRSRSPTDADHLAREEFTRAHGEEMKQVDIVEVLKENVARFKRKKEALSNIASTENITWIQLRRIAEDTLLSTPEFAVDMGAAMEKLESMENAYDIAKSMATDLTRARLAAQHAHLYFTRALNVCDGVRGMSTGGRLLGALGNGCINDLDKMLEYREAVTLASKAQICINEVFRVLEPHEHTIPEDRMSDYRELKNMGMMQMSQIYNLMFGGRVMATGVLGSVKLLQQRQEAVYAHLTRFAVWTQDRVPVCITEEEIASSSRDEVRREAAAFWNASINHDA